MSKKTKLFLLILILLSSCNRGIVRYGEGGAVIEGTGRAKCEKPSKRYAKELDASVKTQVDELNNVPSAELDAKLKTMVVKMSDYTSEGLDRDLLLYRICEMSINRGLTNQQTTDLINNAMGIWNKEIDDQRNTSLALILGFDSAFTLAMEIMGVDITTNISKINGYLDRMQINSIRYPDSPLEDNGNAALDYFKKARGKLSSINQRLEASFILGYFGLICINTPEQCPNDFDFSQLIELSNLQYNLNSSNLENDFQLLIDKERIKIQKY